MPENAAGSLKTFAREGEVPNGQLCRVGCSGNLPFLANFPFFGTTDEEEAIAAPRKVVVLRRSAFWSGCKSPKVVFFSAEGKREKGNGVYDFYETVHPREGEGIEKEEGRGEGGNVCRPQKRGLSRNEDEGRKKGEEEGLLALLLWTCMGSFMGASRK